MDERPQKYTKPIEGVGQVRNKFAKPKGGVEQVTKQVANTKLLRSLITTLQFWTPEGVTK